MFRRALASLTGKVAVAMLAVVAVMAVLGVTIYADAANTINPIDAYQSSSAEHFLGTDELGRDHFGRIAYAAWLSLGLALTATAIGLVGGLLLGSVGWFSGPRITSLAESVIGIAIAFPSLLMILFASVIFGQGMIGAVLAVGIALIPWYARLVQNLILSIRDREFVLAALVQGQSRLSVLLRYILPNVGEPLVVNATLGAAGSLVAFAGLSFLGLGVQAPRYDWGVLLNENMNSFYVTPQPALAAAAMIVITGLGFNLLGESVARSIDASQPAPTRTKVPAPAPDAHASSELVAAVQDLNVSAPRREGDPVRIVDDFSLDVPAGRIIGVVGESGSGKTLTAQSIAQVADETLDVTAQRLTLDGVSYAGTGSSEDPRLVRSVGYVFQDSSSSFNPVLRLDAQIPEALRVHDGLARRSRRAVTAEQLDKVGVPDAESRASHYPHQFSGGMRQRAMIAQATVARPRLVIADEPTTALDVTLKARMLKLLTDLRDRDRASVILISHDISALVNVADDILVMYGGRVVERGPAAAIAGDPQHPYTRMLLHAVPSMESALDEPLPTIPGRPVDFINPPPGCPFAARCPSVMAECETDRPSLTQRASGSEAACHLNEPATAAPAAAPRGAAP